MVYRELDEFIIRLEQAGELIHIPVPVSPELEITEIVERISQSPDGKNKALLFEHVEGSPFPVAVNLFGTARRMAWALGVDDLDELNRRLSGLTDLQIPSTFSAMMSRAGEMLGMLRSLSPVTVDAKSAPVQDVVIAENPDVTLLPLLKFWPEDSGKSLMLASTITHDPLTNTRQVDMCRVEVIGGKTMGLHATPYSNTARHQQTATESRLEKIPVALVLGGDPAEMWCGSVPLPTGIDAYMLAGWIRGKAVKLVKCVTQAVDVPADAEIVIEGWIDLNETRMGGSFGEITGHYSPSKPVHVMRVTAITHRQKAIYPEMIPGRLSQEAVWTRKASERLLLPVMKLLMDEITDLAIPAEGIPDKLVIVSIRKRFPGHAHKAMYGIWGLGPLMLAKAVIVVDDDIDVQNPEAVAKRVLETVDWRRDIVIADGLIHPLDHPLPGDPLVGKIGVDATRKPERSYSTASASFSAEAVSLIAGDTWATWGDSLLIVALDKTTHSVKNILYDLWQVCPNHNIIAIDQDADVNALSTAAWLTLNSVDWRRDVFIMGNPTTRYDDSVTAPGRIGIDATTKAEDDDYPNDWPGKSEMSPEIKDLVDHKWSKYRIR
jgi:4-hydroxy-3-polyprenylbenzoate decarboxylase